MARANGDSKPNLLARLKAKPVVRSVLAVQTRYGEDQAGTFASALAYQAFFSLFPLLALAMSLLGFVMSRRPELMVEWVQRLADAVPGLGPLVRENVQTLVENRAGIGLIALAGLLWTGAGIIRVSGNALNAVHRIPKYQNALKQHAWALGSLVTLGVLGLVSVAAGAFVTGLTAQGVVGLFLAAAATVVTFGIDFTLFMLAYRLLAQRRGPPFAQLVPGALLGAGGWAILKFLGSWYATRAVDGATAVYGTFAATVGLLVMLSLAARLFLYGAVLNQLKIEGGGEMKDERGDRTQQQKTPENGHNERSTVQLVREIATDTTTLVRKEVELARREIVEALLGRAKAAAGFAVAGLFGLFALAFLGLTLAEALDGPLADWAARLIVAALFLLMTGGALLFARATKTVSMVPEETVRTVKEDVEWAKAQLKR